MSSQQKGSYELVPQNDAANRAERGESGGAATAATAAVAAADNFASNAIALSMCFIGLQVSYVTWGYLQEYTMTQTYENGESFPSSLFLVFGNRSLALVAAAFMVYRPGSPHRQPGDKPPFYKFSFCSISNVCSSWAQYEALRFVTFPTQVLFKSSKIIPVMCMGKFLHKKNYPLRDYIEAAIITFGVCIFMLTNKEDNGKGAAGNDFYGLVCLCMYITCDSFTSQWQSALFEKFTLSSYEMMFGVNCFSLGVTGAQLVLSGSMFKCLSFLAENPTAFHHVAILAVTSATGQLFIFYTIKRFGPVIFTIIMTTRQMVSMVLSCVLYGHGIGFMGLVGTFVVFGTVGYRVRRRWLNSRSR